MNKNQPKGSATESKGKVKEGAGKAPGNKRTTNESQTGKNGSKGGAVLGDVNGEAKKTTKSTKKEMK